MSGDDLSNFFYTFRVNDSRAGRNFLDWKIPIKVAQKFKSFPSHLSNSDYVYPCLASLAMGDSAACDYAQTSHISMALQCNALEPQHLLTLHGRAPRGDFCGGIIIDDFCLLEKVPHRATTGKESQVRRRRMHCMYNKVGLNAHPDKGFADQDQATFWGADIDGVEGLVRGNVIRAASLVWVTVRVACMGVCSISLLEILAGGYVALFGFRRRLMSLLEYVYTLQGGRDRRDIIQLPAGAIEELWSLAILCPLAVTDLRASFSERLYMVDASNWGDAVVSCRFGEGMQEEIHRHGVTRSCWTTYKACRRVFSVIMRNCQVIRSHILSIQFGRSVLGVCNMSWSGSVVPSPGGISMWGSSGPSSKRRKLLVRVVMSGFLWEAIRKSVWVLSAREGQPRLASTVSFVRAFLLHLVLVYILHAAMYGPLITLQMTPLEVCPSGSNHVQEICMIWTIF